MLIDFILHLDNYLGSIIKSYGIIAYLILFLIIFIETGLVIMPFLPGDSLLFVAGAFAARRFLDIYLLFFLLSAAAIIGDSINYWIGGYSGNKLEKSRFVKKEYLDRTKEFYNKHGGKTIVLARFIPIIRTFAPFVAGIGKMDYVKFLGFNVFGGMIWVGVFLFGGYFFGQINFIEENLSLVIISIIFISLLPVAFEFIKHKLKN